MKSQTAFLAAALSDLGFDPVKADALTRYGELLLAKNEVMNLTAITEPQQVATLHMLDCAYLAALLPSFDPPAPSLSLPSASPSLTLADVGTGAGFPGLVVAILRPDVAVTLLDPLEKRLNFIQEVITELGLLNVSLLHMRGEDAGRDGALREAFDFTTARAVADLTVLGELCLPLTKINGYFLPMKTPDSGLELEKAQPFLGQLGGVLDGHIDYQIPQTAVIHRIWRIQKIRPTPDTFPRRWSKIKKK